MKKVEGITLVALVITIVVLLILAGITINFIMGDNSIFEKASSAKLQIELGKIEERAQVIYLDKLLKNASNILSSKVETSEVIAQLMAEGHIIEKRTVAEGDITAISLEKESMTMGKNKTAEIKVTFEGVEEPVIYYVAIQEKYYQMHSNKGFLTIDREASTLTKADFEEEGGEGSSTVLKIVNTNTGVITATLKEESNNIIVLTSTETEGEATITATYGTLSSEPCKIKVVEPVLATEIMLNEKDYVVTGGQSWKNDIQLVATLKPNNVTEKEVTWKSNNEEIATVDNNGLVKAGTKGGDVVITVTTKDGTNLSAECKITTELFGAINERKTAYTDSDGNTAQIPDGFAVATSDNVNKVTGGLVAQDNEGNQFVWIPVGEVKKKGVKDFDIVLGRYDFRANKPIPSEPIQTQANYSETVKTLGIYSESINQTGNNAHAKNLKKFIDNAIIDGGYWFARFEASNNSGTKSKYDKVAYVRITQQNAAKEAGKMKSSGTYQSDLANSYAWDTAIIFIEKTGNTGYANQISNNKSVLNTGKSGDKACNIYDMASNYREWGTEFTGANDVPCNYRGGSYESIDSGPSFRNSYSESNVERYYVTFRCLLYRP